MEKIFQIAGYQNSGKTTLMEKIIKQAAQKGLRIASIKHHGHGGLPDGKDSTLHQEAGAFLAGVEGSGLLQLNMYQKTWTLPEILHIYQQLGAEWILVEGFKKEPYPKAVLIRNEEDLRLLSLSNIQCVITWIPISDCPYPVFSIENEKEYIKFITSYF